LPITILQRGAETTQQIHNNVGEHDFKGGADVEYAIVQDEWILIIQNSMGYA
jgi:hypothetical protein